MEDENEQLDLVDENDKVRKFYPTESSPWFRSLYLYEYDEAPNYNRADFQEYYWLTPQELLTKLEDGEPAKSSMSETVRQVIDKLTK